MTKHSVSDSNLTRGQLLSLLENLESMADRAKDEPHRGNIPANIWTVYITGYEDGLGQAIKALREFIEDNYPD